jgi:hypothetical protein
MKRIALAVLILVSACSTPPKEAPPPPPPTAPPPPVTPEPAADTCGAREYQHLIGRSRTDIPVPVKPELQRVACTTCAVTMDFNERRLNFFFDAKTGLIQQVRCG